MKVISIKQPWAHLICAGIKTVENRSWQFPDKYFGQEILVHAGLKSAGELNQLLNRWQDLVLFHHNSTIKFYDQCDFIYGAIIGSITVVDCLQNYDSIWSEKDRYNWIIEKPRLWVRPIFDVKGKLGFWDFEI